ncbi:MAG: hypothetical protein RQ752_11670 [Thermohalobaculum sp.]|nr:hypothetical protein [Thermohalobaculum sp.]
MAQTSTLSIDRRSSPDAAPGEALRRVELPLRDLEFAVQCYLLDHGVRLDTGTRRFLAGLRDAIGALSITAHQLGQGPAGGR